jgi:putative transposase
MTFFTESSEQKIFLFLVEWRITLFLATSNAAKKWTMPIQNWRLAMNWFTIQFDDRLKVIRTEDLSLFS